MNALQSLAYPIARVLLSSIFILSGVQKITGFAGTQAYMEAMGVPGFLLPLVILIEVVGGVALVLGYQTRIAAFLLAGFTAIAGLIFHFQPADQMQMIMFMKNLTIAGGLLFVTASGAGAYALDTRANG